MKRGKYVDTVIPRMTDNRIKILKYCKTHDNTITKAQAMTLFRGTNFPEETAYSVLKGMVKWNILEKVSKNFYKLVQKDI